MEANEGFHVWDSHAHVLPRRRTRGLVRWIKRAFPQHPSREDWSAEDVIGGLRESGVQKIFNLVFPLDEEETDFLNTFSRDLGEKYDCIIPFGSMHLHTPRKDEVVRRCLLEYGLAGIKLHPYVQGFEAFSDSFEPMFHALNDLARPLLVHTGFDVFYSRTQDLDYLEGVFKRYPDMPVVLVHSLFPRFGLALRFLSEYPQVYLDMTNVMSSIRYMEESAVAGAEQQADIEGVRENLDYFYRLLEGYSSRIMFGTDHPAGMGSVRQIYEDLYSFDLDLETRHRLTGDTAREFYAKHCID